MSSASSNVSLPSDTRTGKCVIWLGTFYYDLAPHCIVNMTRDVIWKSDQIRPMYVDIILEFQFVRVSELQFNVTCFRYHGTPDGFKTPTGYKLEFQTSINMFSDEEPTVYEMQSDDFASIIGQFSLDPCYCQFFSPADLQKPFELKIFVKMIECDRVQNDRSFQQNEHLKTLQVQFLNFTSVLTDLCYILRIPTFENVYSGRQNTAFSDVKTRYIKNAVHYSKEIADCLRAKVAGDPVPATDLSVILNFVLHGEREPITDEKLFEGYLIAHLMGMNFLVELCRDFIIGKLPRNVQWVNHSFLIDTLRVSDRVNDRILFEKAAEKFQKWERELENPEALFDLLKSRGIKGRFMMYSLARRSRRIQAERLAAQIGESSQSSAIECITLE